MLGLGVGYFLWYAPYSALARPSSAWRPLTAPERRVHAYGPLYWATSLGSSVSALVAGVLLNLWPPSIFLPAAASAVAYAAIALALPEVPPAGPPRKVWPRTPANRSPLPA
jgi:hypothetical protein